MPENRGTEREGLDIASIAAREAKATPGPWWREEDDAGIYNHETETIEGHPWLEVTRMVLRFDCDYPWREDDADFIAHARQDIPALLAALGRAEAERLSEVRRANMWKAQTAEAARDLRDTEARAERAEAERDQWKRSAETGDRVEFWREEAVAAEARAARYEKALREINRSGPQAPDVATIYRIAAAAQEGE